MSHRSYSRSTSVHLSNADGHFLPNTLASKEEFVRAKMEEALLPEGSNRALNLHVQGFGEIEYGANLVDTLPRMESRKSIRE